MNYLSESAVIVQINFKCVVRKRYMAEVVVHNS